MTDHYNTLGIKKTATEDEIKKAYRKLAMEHHPDRHQGDSEKAAAELKFKAVKEAYEILSDARKRNQYDNGGDNGFEEGLNPRHFHGADADQLFAHLRAMHEHARRNAVPNIHLRVSIEKAFAGAKMALNVFGRSISYSLRAGMPSGVSFADEVPVEDTHRRIQFQLEIISNEFRFMHTGSTDGIFFSGDLERDIEVDALDIMLGNWIVVTDFLGKQLQVRVPAGFDLAHRLKVAGHGYSNWRGDASVGRGDMYLRVIPKFKPLKDLDSKKVEELYNLSKTK